MKIVFKKVFLEHFTGAKRPENRKRLEVFDLLSETSLETAEQYLEPVHARYYIEHVKKSCLKSRALDADTPSSESGETS